jgi:hypothetical protein
MMALGVSALLHLWVAHTAPGLNAQNAKRAFVGSPVPITVLFNEPPVDLSMADSELSVTRAPDREVVQTAATMRGTIAVPHPVERPVITPAAEAGGGRATLPQSSDPTYYSALSLDVYPKATTDLDLGAHFAAGSYTTGQVRATVLIDEAGTVNEVRAIQAVASDIESAARALLLQTRFTPARKDGRIVKAQVQVSLDYGTR